MKRQEGGKRGKRGEDEREDKERERGGDELRSCTRNIRERERREQRDKEGDGRGV